MLAGQQTLFDKIMKKIIYTYTVLLTIVAICNAAEHPLLSSLKPSDYLHVNMSIQGSEKIDTSFIFKNGKVGIHSARKYYEIELTNDDTEKIDEYFSMISKGNKRKEGQKGFDYTIIHLRDKNAIGTWNYQITSPGDSNKPNLPFPELLNRAKESKDKSGKFTLTDSPDIKKEIRDDNNARILRDISKLADIIPVSYDIKQKVTKENWTVVSDSQDKIIKVLVECLAILKSRKEDPNIDNHRKEIEEYRAAVTSYWFYETQSTIDDRNTTLLSLKQDTFLIRHLSRRLLVEMRDFKERSNVSDTNISVLSATLYKNVNAALEWLSPAVDRSIGSPEKLDQSLIIESGSRD